ncbi:MAG: phenylalanine--tRNA ligase subunit beta [Anaerolineae bacterium]|nr:MAG: phenylalanyl-tRNA synthetase beta chain [Chloroflexi bacterium OLB13]MBW7880844.1 phenylalanine--tRNA ligase subunit beta [Anaerolineae bacterium]
MQIPLSWLKELVDIDVPAEVLADRMTKAGIETTLTYIGVPQQHIPGIQMPPSDHLVWDRERIKLGRILEVKPHPDADRLVLAIVDYGADEPEQCVTGAPNLFEYKGIGPLEAPLWTVIALEGAEVWDGHSDTPKRMILKGRPLRGIYNKSMVCSEKELGISDEHEGVILMHDDPGKPVGTPLQDVFGDVVLTVELTPNLARCYSVTGVAREISALLDKPLRMPSTHVMMAGPDISQSVKILIEDADLNPRFTAMLLMGTTIQPSPEWLQRRLKLIGQRPINNIVDVTNYVMFESGQPLHAFDYDKLVERAGGIPTIITRRARPGETVETLDGQLRKLTTDNELVCDTAGPLALAGVMGGAETEISDGTTNVLLESANWHFINVRRTMQQHKIATEASIRFSRGVHQAQAEIGVRRGIELMRQLGGGTVSSGVMDVVAKPAPRIAVTLYESEIKRLTGMAVGIKQAANILVRLQFDVTLRADSLVAVVPDHRTDISDDPVIGQADLIEEIARIIGLDNLPTTLMDETLPEQWSNVPLEREEHTRDVLVALGLQENITHRFSTPEAEALLIPRGAAGRPGLNVPAGADYVRIANPIQPDKTVLRHSLLPNILNAVRSNLRHTSHQAVFEIGSVYFRVAGQQLPDEPSRLAIVLAGPRQPDHFSRQAAPSADFFDLKGIVEGLLRGLHISAWSLKAQGGPSLHPGRSAAITIDGSVAGHFGELHPLVARAFGLPADVPVMVGEFDLERIQNAVNPLYGTAPVPTTPPVYEDIALVVRDSVPAGDLHAVIEQSGGDLLRSARLFDVYTGSSVPQGHKSLAFSLVYQAEDRTLSDAEVAAVRKKIVKAAQKAFDAQLRG